MLTSIELDSKWELSSRLNPKAVGLGHPNIRLLLSEKEKAPPAIKKIRVKAKKTAFINSNTRSLAGVATELRPF